MVNTIKFSQFTPAVQDDSTVKYVGVGSGVNIITGLPFQWTTAGRPPSPYNGLLGYNTNLSAYEYWDGPASEWVEIAGGSVGTVTEINTGTGLTGGPITSSGTISFAAIAANSLWANTTSSTAVPTVTPLSTFLLSANNLFDLTNPATARTNIGLAIGVNVEAWSAVLDDIVGGLMPTSVQLQIGSFNHGTGASSTTYWSGSGVWSTPAGSGGTVNPGTINDLAYYAATGNAVSPIATANNGVLVTSSGGVPSISSTLPSAVTANITSLGTITSGVWNGSIIGLAYGGTNTNLASSLSNGGIVYSTATGMAILPATATASQMLQSGASGAPTWSTSTWPQTTTSNQLLYSSAANTVSGLTGGSNEILASNGSGVPGWTATLPSAVQLNITQVGTITSGVWNGTAIPLAYGGTSADLIASSGGIFYSTASAGAILAGTATANLPLLSGSSSAPSWGAYALNLGGALTTGGAVTLSGAYPVTFTFTGSTSVTFPTSGTLATTTGSVVTINADSGSATPSAGAFTISGGSTGLTTVGSGSTVSLTGTVVITHGGTGVTSVTTTPTASAWSGWDANENAFANNFIPNYATTATAAGTTTLTAASAYYQYFTGSTTQTVLMPVASTLTEGASWYFVNKSTGAVTIQSSGGNNIQVMAAGTNCLVTCILNSGTTASSWNAEYAFNGGEGSGTVNSGTANQLAYYQTTGVAVSGLASANSGVLVTSSAGVPSILSAGTTNQVLQASTSGTPAWSTATYPATTTINQLLYSSSANTVTGLATSTTAVLTTAAGVPTWAGTLSLALGGLNGSLSASNGGIFYSTASAGAILAGTATAGLALLSGASGAPTWSNSPPITRVNVQIFTSSGTYTPTSGMVYCTVETVGGGGGGGGAATSSAGTAATGGGGGGGGYAKKTFSAATLGSSQTITVGSAGSAGTAGNNAGGNGGTTSFGSLLSASGGTGGPGAAAASLAAVPGGAGGIGSATSPGFATNGTPGSGAFNSALLVLGSSGGSSFFGGGAIGLAGATGVGNSATSYGGGGGGAITASSTQNAGGAGFAGIVIVTEYIST